MTAPEIQSRILEVVQLVESYQRTADPEVGDALYAATMPLVDMLDARDECGEPRPPTLGELDAEGVVELVRLAFRCVDPGNPPSAQALAARFN